MQVLKVTGGNPISGTVDVLGSTLSAHKIIAASLFTTEELMIDNVPKNNSVLRLLEIVEGLGVGVAWLSSTRLLISPASLNSYEIPWGEGSQTHSCVLLAGPLLYRLGKAKIPKPRNPDNSYRAINRLIHTWEQLGFGIKENDDFIELSAKSGTPKTSIQFSKPSHYATANAILSSLAVDENITLRNVSDDPEIEDLKAFLKAFGVEVTNTEDNVLEIKNVNVFSLSKDYSSGTPIIKLSGDRNLVITYATIAIITEGNIVIRGINRLNLLPFTNVLAKANVHFEISDSEMRVWNSGGNLEPQKLKSQPAPGIRPEWLPLLVLMLTQADGVSCIYDTMYRDRLYFVRDLNALNARIEITTPSEAGFDYDAQDDNYNFEAMGEPKTVAKVTGPTKLKGGRVVIQDPYSAPALLAGALSATGNSEIHNAHLLEEFFADLVKVLVDLGANISVDS